MEPKQPATGTPAPKTQTVVIDTEITGVNPAIVIPPGGTPSINPPQQLPTQVLIANNLSARFHQAVAVVGYVLLAKWGLIPGMAAAGFIAATVLPPELVRQFVKPAIARGAAQHVPPTLTTLLTWGPVGAAALATVQHLLS